MSDTEDEIARLYRAEQRELLAETTQAEAELKPLFAETSEHIRMELKAADNANGVAIRETIARGFEKTVFKRRKIIAKVIESSAKRGPKLVRKTFRAVYGDDVTRAQLRSSKAALMEGEARILGRLSVDNVALSKRIRKWDKRIGEEMAVEVERGLKARKGIERIAKKIQKLDTAVEELPKYLQEVEALARAGSPELKRVAKGYLKRATKTMGTMVDGSLKSTPYSLRSPTQKFLRDVQKAGVDGIDRVVKEYVEKKAAWRAKVIARNESLNALQESYVKNAERKPGVYAFRWRLSGAHKKADECDVHANANQFGLGVGLYPGNAIPHRHPGDMCVVTAAMDQRHFERGEGDPGPRVEYADKKSPDAAGWLKQNPDKAAAILGPTRFELMQRGRNVLDATGKPLPVGELLGRHAHAAE